MAKDQTSYLPPPSPRSSRTEDLAVPPAPLTTPPPSSEESSQRTPSTPLRLSHIPSRFTPPQPTLENIYPRRVSPVTCWQTLSSEASRAEDIRTARESLAAVDQIFMIGPYQADLVITHLTSAHLALESLVRADGCRLHPSTERWVNQYFSLLAIAQEDDQLRGEGALLNQLSQFTVDRTDGGLRIYQAGQDGLSLVEVPPGSVVVIEETDPSPN